MPAYANPRAKRSGRFNSKGIKRRRLSRAFRAGVKRQKRLSRKPRFQVKKGLRASNIHCFSRSRSAWISLTAAPNSDEVKVNVDSTYAIVDLATFWGQYPDCQDTVYHDPLPASIDPSGHHIEVKGQNAFRNLFTNYQITGIDSKLVPNYRNNASASAAVTQAPAGGHTWPAAIPNYEATYSHCLLESN